MKRVQCFASSPHGKITFFDPFMSNLTAAVNCGTVVAVYSIDAIDVVLVLLLEGVTLEGGETVMSVNELS